MGHTLCQRIAQSIPDAPDGFAIGLATQELDEPFWQVIGIFNIAGCGHEMQARRQFKRIILDGLEIIGNPVLGEARVKIWQKKLLKILPC